MQTSHTAQVFHQAYQESARGTDVQAISLIMFLVIGYLVGRWRGKRAARREFDRHARDVAILANRVRDYEAMHERLR